MPRAKPKTKTLAPPTIGGRSEVKKHNNAIHVSGELSLVGRKLVNVLLLNAYDNLARHREHTIPVPLLCDLIGWESSGNIDSLKEALRQLASTPIEFDLFNRDGKPKWDITAMVAHAQIEGGVCRYEYSKFLSEKLSDPEMYSIINIGVQREFKGAYSLALYENCLRFRGTDSGSTGYWPIATWRKVLGASAPLYDEFKFFSSKVIKPAVDEINKVSDLIVEPEYQRKGRFVTDIRFLVKDNPQRSLLDMAPDANGITDSDAYKLLIELGVGATLARSMVQKDEARATEIATYTKERLDKGEITGSAGGYARTLFESNAVVKQPPKRKTTKAAEPSEEEKKRDAMAAKQRSAATALTAEEVGVLVREFIAETGASSYSEEKGRFTKATESTAFTSYRIKRAPDLIAERA